MSVFLQIGNTRLLLSEGGCTADGFYLVDNPKKVGVMSYQGFNSITNYLTLAPWFLE